MRNFVIAIGFGLLSAGATHAAEQQARIEVSGLWCPSCSFIAGEALKKPASVEIVEYVVADDGETAIYVVSYDDAVTNPDEIAAQPLEYGYPAKVLPADASNS